MYDTLAALTSASGTVVVGNVTSEQTVGVNVSAVFGSAAVGLVPVTNYYIDVTTVISGEWSLEPGDGQLVAQVGGTVGANTMNVTGYPTLSVGQSYVFFLTYQSPTSGLYGSAATTTGAGQGLFYIQGGNVYSLNNLYPQADSWLPVTADGVPLNQFVSEVQAATTNSSTVASTEPCSAPGVYCGTFQITSGSLTVNGSSSVLQLTLLETGSESMTSATVYINGTVVGAHPTPASEPPGNIAISLVPKQQKVLTLTIPSSTIPILAGRTYTVLVYAWEEQFGRAADSSQETVNIAATQLTTSTSASTTTTSAGSTLALSPTILSGIALMSVVLVVALALGSNRRSVYHSTTCG